LTTTLFCLFGRVELLVEIGTGGASGTSRAGVSGVPHVPHVPGVPHVPSVPSVPGLRVLVPLRPVIIGISSGISRTHEHEIRFHPARDELRVQIGLVDVRVGLEVLVTLAAAFTLVSVYVRVGVGVGLCFGALALVKRQDIAPQQVVVHAHLLLPPATVARA
jgi:hypothetical protein